MTTLYVGDLHPGVTQSMLLEKFSSFGRVCNLRLCLNTGTSLQYAFINFQHRADAEHALEMLNFDILLGQPMRIMWSQSDSSFRNCNKGNIFIKGLEKSIDSMALYDTFSTFGNILSCKVVCDENGSRGFGYVHFESAEAAEAAIKRLNGMLFNDHYVFITHFKSRKERQEQKKEERHPKPQHKFEQCKEKRQASLSSQGTQAAQKAVANHHQPAPSCDKIMNAIPQNSTDNSTTIHQVEPHLSTHRARQDIQLQS